MDYNSDAVREAKELFLSSGEVPDGSSVREEVSESWARCLKGGMKTSDLPKLTEHRHLPVLDENIWLGEYVIKDTLESFYNYVESLDGMVFFAYDERVIIDFSSGKRPDCMEDLPLQPGVLLDESSLGTTAFSLLSPLEDEAWAMGEEHYLDCFKDFATYCCQAKDYSGRDHFIFVVLPLEKFNPLTLNYIRLFQRAKHEAIVRQAIQLEKAMLDSVIESNVDVTGKGLLFADNFGAILWVNKRFSKLFDLKLEEIRGRQIVDYFPELADAVRKYRSGDAITQEDVTFSCEHNGRFITCSNFVPFLQSRRMQGLAIAFKAHDFATKRKFPGSANTARYIFDDLIGESASFKHAVDEAATFARLNSSILLTGESGVGKELFAQSIHNASPRKKGPFVAINCATLQSNLIESELFGYAEGAFTGARKGGAVGKIEFANKGTLFLGEIGELPLSTQTMFLRALEEKEITRVGSNKRIPVDFRLVCATNRNLETMVEEGSFRLDLYYRINVVNIELPPLRDRGSDVVLLSNYFIKSICDELDIAQPTMSKEAMQKLKDYSWPGNLRELRNVIERAIVISKDGIIRVDDLPSQVTA